jgi:glucosamine-6-phosphate deaminase
MPTRPESTTPDAAVAREHIPVAVHATSAAASAAVAREIADLIRAKAARGQRAVLGLATGSTPVGVYAELVRLHQEEGLSFASVTSFNLDEYWPMAPDDPRSFHAVMRRQLFAYVDLAPGRTHLLDGSLPLERLPAACAEYERAIVAAGGLDLVLLGMGGNGHVAFNEPGSPADARTRLAVLDESTRSAAGGMLPEHALTLGLGTILEARALVLLAFGEHKADIVRRALTGPADASVPASLLQRHADVHVLLDPAAASALSHG